MKIALLSIAMAFAIPANPTHAQITAPPPIITTAGPDPLAIGKAALRKHDYAAAHEFFAKVVAATPGDVEAMYYLAESDLELKNFPAAKTECSAVVTATPKEWGAHRCLIFIAAQTGDWAAFDKEMALLKSARDAHAPGLDPAAAERIDQLTVAGESFEVRYYYKLHGQYNVRYVFLHFDKEGRADHWVQMESDDVDQGSFKDKHPKEAAAGDRAFSLDTYSRTEKGMTQGLIKFYFDGEPTYEKVRADVLGVLSHNTAPAATTNTK